MGGVASLALSAILAFFEERHTSALARPTVQYAWKEVIHRQEDDDSDIISRGEKHVSNC